MKNVYFALFLAFFIMACKNDKVVFDEKITKLEEQIKAGTKDNRLYFTLNKEYQNMLQDDKLSKAEKEKILEHAYQFFKSQDKNYFALPYLKELLKNHRQYKLKEHTLDMISIFDTDKNKDFAGVLKMIYVNTYPGDKENVDKFLAQTGNKKINFDSLMFNLGKKVVTDFETKGTINIEAAKDYINYTEAFVLINPGDKRSPEYLFKAAEIAHSVKSTGKTMEFYDWILEKYPDYDKVATVLFLKGFILSDELKKYDEAKKIFNEFLEKYPDSELADDVQSLLKYMGKSDKEILEMMEKNKEKGK